MKKDIVYIGLEFLFGPIQKFEEDKDGNAITGIEIIDKDSITQTLDAQINELWCSLFSKNDNSSSGFEFNKEREQQLAPQLISLLDKLRNRLNELNDGSFEVEDMITEHLKAIIQ